jgi:hypothetical protein
MCQLNTKYTNIHYLKSSFSFSHLDDAHSMMTTCLNVVVDNNVTTQVSNQPFFLVWIELTFKLASRHMVSINFPLPNTYMVYITLFC